jgi:hypothetical protein
MAHAGRKPLGLRVIEHHEASSRTKQRWEVIQETIHGQLTVGEACQRLGIKPAMFYRLRHESIDGSLDRLEPRRMGRPPYQVSAEELRIADLERQVAELTSALAVAKVQQDATSILLNASQGDSPGKKTPRSARRASRGQKKRRPRRLPPNRCPQPPE